MSSGNEQAWEEAKEEIRDRVSIVNVVEDYVSLEKKGQNHWALCPFHNEDTASFSVNPDLGIYKCFGCGKGGDVFSFIQEIEHCDFMEAMKILSDRSAVDLPSTSDDVQRDDSPRQNMLSVNEYTAKKYREAFTSEVGSAAREYMFERGFQPEVLDQFRVGYAPDGWNNLIRAMKRDGYDLQWARKVGLIDRSQKTGNLYDKFRNRVMFPIMNPSGRVVGFGGRILEEDDQGPKYLNSKESPVFSKRRILYGLPQARPAIRKQNYCLVMEGYTDVIRCHQAGFETALASLGTAMTREHVQTLRKYADEVILIYDGDEAGIRAARRGGKIALQHGMKASVVLLSEGTDPADVVGTDPGVFHEHIQDRRPYLDVLYQWLTEEHDPDQAEGKTSILKGMASLIRSIDSEVQREEWIRTLASRLGVQDDTVLTVLNRDAKKNSSSASGSLTEKIKRSSGATIEEIFFRCLGAHPEKFEDVLEILSRKDFQDDRSRTLMKSLQSFQHEGKSFSVEKWLDRIPEDLLSYLAGLLNREDAPELNRIDPVQVAKKIKQNSARRERGRLAEALQQQDKTSGAGQLDKVKKDILKETTEMKRRETGEDH